MNTEPPLLPQLNVSGPEPVTRIRVQDGDTKVIHQACLFKIHGRIIAAFATSVGVQLWDNDAQQKLYSWPSDPLVAKPGTSSAASAHKGLAVVQTENDACVLCVGNDFGSIHVFAVSDASSVQHSHDISHHQAPISTLAAGQALSSSLLASGDDHGALAVFKAASACNFQVLHKWEGVGIPCVSTAVKGTTLVGAFYDGSVRLHSLVDGTVTAEVQAHSRLLSALAAHPTQQLFATAAEDATAAVWTLTEDGRQMRPMLSVCWNNALLTGIAFAGASSNSIAVAAYDMDEIAVWPLDNSMTPMLT